MALTLYIYRHAKSAWDDPALDDYDRPLSERGINAAGAMGAWMKRRRITPDMVLCSTASRAQQTALLTFMAAGSPGRIVYDRALYLAPLARLCESIARTEPSIQKLMLIGHNPGLEDLATHLTREDDSADRARMAEKYPTAALAEIAFVSDLWSEAARGGGKLLRFITPRTL